MTGRRIFLTGATGTVGMALARRLLANRDDRLTLLIRAADDAAMAARLDDLIAHLGAVAGSPDRARVTAVRGDISAPNLGLPADIADRLVASTTHIVHCAASVKLTMSPEEARSTAVVPTRSVLEIARRAAAAGALEKLDVVSTVGVWGRTPGRMPERPLPEVTEFHNTYEAAKSEAERVLFTEGEGLPLTVHRPSMVVGSTGSGRVAHFQIFYHLCEFLSGARTFGVMPQLGQTRLDTVPVDWVADVIAWSVEHAELSGQILHLCSGPELSTPLPMLQQRVRALWKEKGLPLPPLRTVSRRLLQGAVPLIGAVSGSRTRRALRALGPVLEYLAETQSFGNDATMQRLTAAGMPVPPPETYLDPVLRFYLDRRRA